MTSRVDYGLDKNWYNLYDSNIQSMLSFFKDYSPSASNIVDSIGQQISGSGIESDPFILRQTNFDHGTYRMLTPGYYQLNENIIFAPNASVSSSTDPTYDSQVFPITTGATGNHSSSNVLDNFRPLRTQRLPGGQYSSANFGLGFFAGITVEPNASGGVVLDMNNKRFECHTLFNAQQRFYAHIELASGPFLSPQGPGTGIDSQAGHNIWIKNGTFGLSPHHAIHGNSMTNVLLENLTCMNNEIAGIALNGGKNILLRNIFISHNSRQVPVNSNYSHAMFMREFLQKLANMDSADFAIESFDNNTAAGQKGAAWIPINGSNVVSIGGGRGLDFGVSISGVVTAGSGYVDGIYGLKVDNTTHDARAYVKTFAGGVQNITITDSGGAGGSTYVVGGAVSISGVAETPTSASHINSAMAVVMAVDGGDAITQIADKKSVIANLEESLINDVYIPVANGVNVSNTLFALDSASNTRNTVAGNPREVTGEKLIDGAYYGILLNGKGVAVNDWAKNRDGISDDFGDNIVMHNISINKLTGMSREVIALGNASNVSSTGVSMGQQAGPAGEDIRYMELSSPSGSGTYKTNVVADGEFILARYNASGQTPDVASACGVTSIAVDEGGSGYTMVPTVGFTGGAGAGVTATVTLTAQVVTSIDVNTPGIGYTTTAPTVTFSGGGGGTGAEATATITNIGMASRTLGNTPYFMQHWVESASAVTNVSSQLDRFVGPNAAEGYNLRWLNLHDTMFHVMKGNVALFLDGVQNIRCKYITINDVQNLDPGGDDDLNRVLDYNNIMNGSGTSQGLTFKTYQGSAQRGIAVSGCNRISMEDVDINNIYSENGLAYGIDIINSCSNVHFKNTSVKNVRGSNIHDHTLEDRIFQTGLSIDSVAIDTDATAYPAAAGATVVVISSSGVDYNRYGLGCRVGASGTISEETLTLENGGLGYSFEPVISFRGGTASNAGNASATISGGQLTAITVTDAGTGYSADPEVIISGGGEFASGATATATRTGITIASIAVGNRGTGYTEEPTISFRNGGYSTFAATMTSASSTGMPVNTRLPIYATPAYRRDAYNGGTIAPNPRPESSAVHVDLNTTHTDLTFDTSENGTGVPQVIPNNIIVTTGYP